ncbi:Uncharacterized protein OBRU01_07611 [Operophtera brumata]|uniref:Fatty acyl-CoA reductase C-terminal domain-containing protein n=1 Tax=Operophtera brumata TaxID=104452 RepID=A0A0L7KU46_OPEBR|nr:Uncharacterized protein OBRU01_07611 [Operophtera brumata]
MEFRNELSFYLSNDVRNFASPKAIWWGFAFETSNYYSHLLYTVFLHYIPAYLVDGVSSLIGKKSGMKLITKPALPGAWPKAGTACRQNGHAYNSISTRLLTLYKKIYKMAIVMSYFTTNEWIFKDENTVGLRKRMSENDRLIYNFDITDINISELVVLWALGLRKYVVKDGLKNTQVGIERQQKFKIITFAMLSIFCLCLLWGLLSFEIHH